MKYLYCVQGSVDQGINMRVTFKQGQHLKNHLYICQVYFKMYREPSLLHEVLMPILNISKPLVNAIHKPDPFVYILCDSTAVEKLSFRFFSKAVRQTIWNRLKPEFEATARFNSLVAWLLQPLLRTK